LCTVITADKGLRLLCGGGSKGNKIQQHSFHLGCWRRAVEALDDEDAKRELLISPSEIGVSSGVGLSWKDLTAEGERGDHKRMGVGSLSY